MLPFLGQLVKPFLLGFISFFAVIYSIVRVVSFIKSMSLP